MKRTLILTLVVCALLASAIYAFADIAKPKPSPAEGKTILYTGLTVTSDPKAYEARLQISQETLKHLQNAAANNGGDGSLVQSVMHSSTRTIMAGVFMFLAVSFAGIWFARSSQRRNHKAIAAVFLVAIVFGIATVVVRANAGPPGYIRWQNLPQSLKDGKETVGGLQIELVPGDDNLKLIIPLRKTNKPGEE
jgi:ABC-type glycerol-3-phosphate transport system permease component